MFTAARTNHKHFHQEQRLPFFVNLPSEAYRMPSATPSRTSPLKMRHIVARKQLLTVIS
jgi:hypothetical protein